MNNSGKRYSSAKSLKYFFRFLKWHIFQAYIALRPASYKLPHQDRIFLEQVVLRSIFLEELKKHILSVGCASYTAWYPFFFEHFSSIRYETVEADPHRRKYGSGKHHFTGTFELFADSPEKKEFYDLVILNGLIGFGTDDSQAALQVISSAHRVLQSGGMVLIGYNDLGGKFHFDPDWMDKNRFEKAQIPGTDQHDWVGLEEQRHRFLCFVKK